MSRMTKASFTDEASAIWTDTTGTCSAPALPPPRSRHDPARPKPRLRATAPPHERAQPGGQRFHAGPPPVRHLGTGGSAAESRPRPHIVGQPYFVTWRGAAA